jgi:hypothetical protein
METLYSSSVRNRNNDNLSTGDLLLSDFVTVATLGEVRLRLEIASIDAGAEVQISVDWRNGDLVLGSFSRTRNAAGYYEFGISRGDADDTTIFNASINFVNRCRAGFDVLAITQGEDVLPWP